MKATETFIDRVIKKSIKLGVNTFLVSPKDLEEMSLKADSNGHFKIPPFIAKISIPIRVVPDRVVQDGEIIHIKGL